MERSPYLSQALAAMGQAPAQPQESPVDAEALMGVIKQRKDWQAANPGQSYAKNRLQTLGQNIKGLPGRLGAIPGNVAGNLASLPGSIAGMPGQAMGGLMDLGRSFMGK